MRNFILFVEKCFHTRERTQSNSQYLWFKSFCLMSWFYELFYVAPNWILLFYQCSWSNYRYYPELLFFYTIRVHSVALAFLNLISYESLVLLDERYPTHKHYLFAVNITYAFLLFYMLSSIWQGRDANGLNILHEWRN